MTRGVIIAAILALSLATPALSFGKAAAVPPPPEKKAGLGAKMVLGALGGMGAATFCHPLDVIRVQMQVGSGATAFKNPLEASIKIVSENGIAKGLYSGIGAAYLRQWTYGSCRVGIYAFLLEKFAKADREQGKSVPFWKKALMGCTSGAIGSMAGMPSEVALVRMGADTKMAPELRRNYKNIGDCLTRIVKEEGPLKLWSGGVPTVIRATLLSATVLGVYSEAKEQLHAKYPHIFQNKDGIPLMFCSTMVASFLATGVSNPFDVVKSRVQQNPGMYKSMGDCFVRSIQAEGMPVLMKGFTPAFLKLAPYTTISLILTDKLTKQIYGKSAL